jgi:Transposase DDE domain
MSEPVDPSHRLTADSVALSAQVRETLTPAFIAEALRQGLPDYRARILTIEVVVLCVLHLLLHGLSSLRMVVRALELGGISGLVRLRVTPQALAQRLVALPHTVFLDLLIHTVTALRPEARTHPERARLAPFAAALVGIDDTTLDKVLRKSDAFPHVAEGKATGLGGRVGAALDLVTGLIRAVAYDTDAGGNERHRLLPLVQALPVGSLVVFDLGYFAFDLFDALGEHFTYFVTRMKGRVAHRVVHTMVDALDYRDQLVWLGSGGGKAQMRWPVRLIEVRVGNDWWSYVTNVWEPSLLHPMDAVRIYEARWSLERTFAALKRALGLHTLHTCHVNGILIQVWASLLLYQVLDVLRTAVASARDWAPDEVSWPMLMEALGTYAAQPQAEPLPAWLIRHARALNLRVAGVERRKRVPISKALRTDLQTPRAPLPLDQITPQRPYRRPDRFAAKKQTKPSEKFFVVLVPDVPLAESLN